MAEQGAQIIPNRRNKQHSPTNQDVSQMSLVSLIQLASACIGIIGSLFFAIGVMRQSVEAMGRLSGSYWDSNPHMPPVLAAQKADYIFGGCVIVAAFVFQLISFFVPPETVALTTTQAAMAPWIATVLTAVAFLLLRVGSQHVAKHFEMQITAWLSQRNTRPPQGD